MDGLLSSENRTYKLQSVPTFLEFYQSLDNDPLKRGKQFERFAKWFLKNDPEWATQVDQVWLWSEYPDRWGIDCGIDLIFRHKNGEIWAVQAKCYSPEHTITKHDVDKFLSESNRLGIDKRLLIATTNRIGANAKQVCDAQVKTVVRYLLSNFEAADLEYPDPFSELHAAKRKDKPQPRDHQVEAIDAVVKNFQDVDRGQLIMACGTGKTYTTLWIKEKLGSQRTLLLLPSLSLLAQTLREWTFAANQPFDVLCVCSDETVGKRGEDEIIHSVSELAFPVSSDQEEIRRFIEKDGAKVIFCTYQSSPLVADAQINQTIPAFDLVIADEAHRCTGKVTSNFSTVLDSKRLRATRRLFATATPRTYTTSVKKAAENRGIEVVGMDDEQIFGKVLYSLPFGEAIRRNLLTDYRVVIIGVDNPMISEWIKNRELIKTDAGLENDAEYLAAQIGLLKAINDYDLKRIISFHSRVSRAESFKDDIQQVLNWIVEEHRPSGDLWADFVSGVMPADRRRQRLDRLKNLGNEERGLLTNARCLAEGVDVPSLDGIAFIDPKSSQIDIVQAVGRAIRLSKDKKFGTIVLPVFIEPGDNAIASIEASNFKPVWDVLNAFKSHDEELAQQLDTIRTELGRKPGSKVNSQDIFKITIDLPVSVDSDFGDSIRTYLVEQSTAPWYFWYGLLEQYVAKHGNSLVPADFRLPNGYFLGKWVSHQRFGKDRLSTEQQAKLEQLPGWTWNAVEEQWKTGFRYLEEYAKKHGDCLVPALLRLPNGYKLGPWVSHQRLNKDSLPADRSARLAALPGWTWDPHTDKWEKGFHNLKQYVAEHGNCLIPALLRLSNGYRLGQWVSSQRSKKESLSPEQKERLEALAGWTWNVVEDEWHVGFKLLQEYAKEHGNCLVPGTLKLPDGYRLGKWIRNQRRRKDRLSTEQQAKLEQLPGWRWIWNKFQEQWETGFRYLEEYAKEHGNCLVPDNFKLANGYNLGQWVRVQRVRVQRIGKEELSSERKARLEALTGWTWSPYSDQWETGFRYLQEYAGKHGNCSVSQHFELDNGFKLGLWVNNQRHRKNKLSVDQQTRLANLDGWSWDPYLDKWEAGFRHLQQYVTKNGHSKVLLSFVDADGYKLGNWVGSLRQYKERLTNEQINRLEALPGWSWDPLKEQWEEAFRQLQIYVNLYGNAKVSRNYVSAGFKLGAWVGKQRQNKSRNLLSQDRIERLEALPGWSWDPFTEQWEEGFEKLQVYLKQEGNALVPRNYVAPDGFNLGGWAHRQRQNKSKGLLSQDRIERLEALDGWAWSFKKETK